MKITFFVLKFPILSETFVINQIRELIKLGEDVSVISINEPSYKETSNQMLDLDVNTHYLITQKNNNKYSILRGVIWNFTKIHLVSNFRVYRSIYKRSTIKDFIYFLYIVSANKKIYSDVFLCHFGPNGVLANNLKKAGLVKGKIATVFHGFDITVKATLDKYAFDYKLLFKETELMLPISTLWKRKLIDLGCPPEKCIVNHMGIDLDEFRYYPKKLEADRPLRVLLTGRAIEKKGIKYAISAISLCGFDVELRVIGNGPLYDKLQELIDHLGLQKKISLLGAQPNLIVQNNLRWADVLLLPSITAADGDMEGIPVSLMEAMATGVLVVSTFHSGIPELVEHNRNGLLTREKDAAGIANALSTIRKEEIDIHHLSINARKTIEEKFNNKINYKRLLGSLIELTENQTLPESIPDRQV